MQAKGGDGRALSTDDNDFNDAFAPPAVQGEELRNFVEEIEELEKDKRGIGKNIQKVKMRAKVAGYDPGVIAFVVRERRKDDEKVEQFNQLLEAYRQALS